ncbi:hypothetical protein ACHAPT_011188 [Fusarium lateritium]
MSSFAPSSRDIANNDPDVKGSRPPSTPINHHSDLTREEKIGLIDLLALYTSMREHPSDQAEIYHDFLRDIFHFWDTADGVETPNALRPRSFGDMSTRRQSSYVDLKYGLTLTMARAQVIEKYDRRERARLTVYNRELVVNAARRRICKWARDGTANGAGIDDEDRLEEADLVEIFLTRDYFEEQLRFLSFLAE